MPSEYEYGQLAQAAYGGPEGTSVPLGMEANWEILREADGRPVEMHSETSGYFGQAFRNKNTGEVVIASRGSRAIGSDGSMVDWGKTDLLEIGGGKLGLRKGPPESFKDAEAFARRVNENFKPTKLSFTGHSKGAAEAEYSAGVLDEGREAVTFASPGAAFALNEDQIAKAKPFVRNLALPGDVVPAIGRQVGSSDTLGRTAGLAARDVAFNVVLPLAGLLIAPGLALLGLLVGVGLDLKYIHPMENYLAAMRASPACGGGPMQARITDMHTCPMVTGLVPHVGGPIAIGCPTVLVGGQMAARVGDMATCVGPPDAIAKGSATVRIGGMAAARLGDMTVHGGVITVGFPTVMTGG
ncbi:PAAR domain-containing protein [Novosphingobium sp.]|uniref:PAAR domain-containing protein n=1 Tax=Novosphingobium sp. TaxID=1874826 RepID=UPI0025DD8A4F|nr:PAAR domain-containing protein [Novosphingobium sp.]